jgi:hypothetical protein
MPDKNPRTSIPGKARVLNGTASTSHGAGIVGCALLSLSLAAVAPVCNSATPIYKCVDGNLGLLYTDEPCKNGELLNVRAGDADPAALARLERAREALDQSAAQRVADERRAATVQDLSAWYARPGLPGPYDDMAAYAPFDYGLTWWLPAFGAAHPPRPRPPKPLAPRGLTLKSPLMMPRR